MKIPPSNNKPATKSHCCHIFLPGTEEGEVSVVASQLRGYGVWDGAMGQDGTLLAGCTGPAPSLLFLWVTDAQANLLQMELTSIQTSGTASGIRNASSFTARSYISSQTEVKVLQPKQTRSDLDFGFAPFQFLSCNSCRRLCNQSAELRTGRGSRPCFIPVSLLQPR